MGEDLLVCGWYMPDARDEEERVTRSDFPIRILWGAVPGGDERILLFAQQGITEVQYRMADHSTVSACCRAFMDD